MTMLLFLFIYLWQLNFTIDSFLIDRRASVKLLTVGYVEYHEVV
jgi:hypothetical protein